METSTAATAEETIRKVAENYQGQIITRKVVEQMSGGAFTAKSLVTLDCQGKGIPGGFKVGKKVAYPLDMVTDWLISKVKTDN